MAYRFQINNAEPSVAGGQALVSFDVMLQMGDDVEGWEPVDGGHRTVQLTASQVAGARNGAEVVEMIEQVIRDSWGIVAAHQAWQRIEGWVKEWPIYAPVD